jgi:transketolase
MRGIPGMQVLCPADAEDLVIALDPILASPSPCYMRHTSAPPAVKHAAEFEFGKAETILKDG